MMASSFSKFINKIISDEVLTRSAALAFYACFTLGPTILLLMWILNLIQLSLQADMAQLLKVYVGDDAKYVFDLIISNIKEHPDFASTSGWIGSILLFFSSTVMFSELQTTLDVIFKCSPKSEQHTNIFKMAKEFIFKKLISFFMILILIVLSILSTIFSSAFRFFTKYTYYAVGELIHFGVIFIIFTTIFSLIFKLLPNRKLKCKESLLGGLCTTTLFLIGKALITFYLSNTTIGATYGAARSFILLLVWIYYSTFTILIGAECSYALISNWKSTKKLDS